MAWKTDKVRKPLRMGPTTMENGWMVYNKGRDNLSEPTKEFTLEVGSIISSMVTERWLGSMVKSTTENMNSIKNQAKEGLNGQMVKCMMECGTKGCSMGKASTWIKKVKLEKGNGNRANESNGLMLKQTKSIIKYDEFFLQIM